MTLYLKYRPQTIDDLDLKSVRDSLTSLLSQKDIPQAFLFAGPKGTGKTSAARIVAKALNCEERVRTTDSGLQQGKSSSQKSVVIQSMEPCNTCSTCLAITRGEHLDVIEIDAASHRGIDDIRLLRDAVKLAPTSSAKKIYIIDEAHMLTTEACNALLKMLEEPPSHVVFILATTNPEKLIDTIRSRTRLIQFTKATSEDVVRRLEKIAKGEGIVVETSVLELIAKASDGAFRDAVKLFEQVITEVKELTEKEVSEFIFGSTSFNPQIFIEKLLAQDTKGSLDLIEHGVQQGISSKMMAKGILDYLRKQLMENIANPTNKQMANERTGTIELIELFSKAYVEIPHAYLEQLPLEIAVMKWGVEKEIEKKDQSNENSQIPISNLKPSKAETAPVEESEKVKAKGEKGEDRRMLNQVQHDVNGPVKSGRMTAATDAIVTEGAFSDSVWVQVLADIRPKNAATEALLRACKPFSFDGKVLTIGVYYKFHKERLESHPHRDLLEETLSGILGDIIRISCMLTEPPAKVVAEEVHVNHEVVLTESQSDGTILKAAKDIFGN